jgi:hypothetical protein
MRLLACLVIMAAGGGGETAGDDAGMDGGARVDAGEGDDDAGRGEDDAGGGEDDAGADAGDPSDDAGPACIAEGECAGFPTVEVALTMADSVANCVGVEHEIDCCGRRRVFGANHAVRETGGSNLDICGAEDDCRAMYPDPSGCTDDTIETDSGETTTNIDEVRVRCVGGAGGACTCETFVCTEASCLASSGPIGSCG